MIGEAWYIDSIDVRGGLAFASWRVSDLNYTKIDLDRPAVFVSPPLFQPEAVTNRATGFSLARGQAQLGVYLEDNELAFGTIEELTEFVRRAYVGSGGNDPDEGDGGGPPVLPEPPPDVPLEGLGSIKKENKRSPINKIASEAFNLAEEMDSEFQPDLTIKSEPFNATKSNLSTDIQSVAVLVDGAREILFELVRRLPKNGTETEALQKWTRSAHSLGAALNRTGLWSTIIEGPDWDIFNKLGPYGMWSYWESVTSLGGDPVDHLTYWPLPTEFANNFEITKDNPSAFHLLSSTSANPSQLVAKKLSPTNLGARVESVLLFCAAYLLSESKPRGYFWGNREAREAEEKLMVYEATDWLLRQWPTLIFPARVEQIIGTAATLSRLN